MEICEGRRRYLMASDRALQIGKRYRIVNTQNLLKTCGIDTLEGVECTIKTIEMCSDPEMYDGKVARIMREGDTPEDYQYWVPPECLLPVE